ncbi:hypothetical protein ACFHW2_29380 [Actinomadura sp. LOL_016]|uniref:hypothetical protein n=1 Tax=unclassified Actinomadura TaxID=2626254 RepID=UPI003A811951
MAAGLRFLPWVRDGLARAVTGADPLSGALPRLRGEIPLHVDFTADDGQVVPADTTAAIHGPGDVTGLDDRQIIRSFPAPGTDGAEDTLFAAVEFDRPDLPWAFTPAEADAQGRLRPWLVLAVVPADDGGIAAPAGALPTLTCAVGELPPLDESWAWAHAQVLLTEEDDDVAAVLRDHPGRTLSRLICPRRLAARTRYHAAVVPAFEAGRLAGTGGRPAQTGALVPAWGPGSPKPGARDIVVLPAYHHWSLTTGPDGDFESLVRRLRARPLPPEVGKRPVDIAAPGGGLPVTEPAGVEGSSVLGFEGALASPVMEPTAWDADVRASWRQVIEGLLQDVDEWLTPPLYGSVHSGDVDLPAGEPAWLRELNLDPRYRSAAALGTEIVQRHQEDLAAAAWDAAAAVRDMNERLLKGQAARDVSTALHGKRLDPDRPGRALADARLLAVAGPALGEIEAPDGARNGAGRAPTVGGELEGNAGLRAATSVPLRRLLRPRGPVARRAGMVPAAVERLATGETAVPPADVPTGGSAFTKVAGRTLGSVDRASIEAAMADPWWDAAQATAVPDAAATVPDAAATVPDDVPRTLASEGGDMVHGRFFVATSDGHLFERRLVEGGRLWLDHGLPPSGRAVVSAGAALLNGGPVKVLVRTADGRLWERYWHAPGGGFRWADRGSPPGGVRSDPHAGGDSVYVLGGDGGLHALDHDHQTGDWTWRALGRPSTPSPKEVLVGPLSSRNRSFVYVTTNLGGLYACVRHGLTDREWINLNVGPLPTPPVNGNLAAPYPGYSNLEGMAYASAQGYLILTRADLRPASNYWHPYDGTSVVSVARQSGRDFAGRSTIGMLVVSDADPSDVSLCRLDRVGDSWTWSGTRLRPAGGLSRRQPGPVALRDGRDSELFAVTADGRLVSVDHNSVWTDHGFPRDARGAGAPDEVPAPDKRWASRVGLFSSLIVADFSREGGAGRVRHRVAHGFDAEGRIGDFSGARTGPDLGGIDVSVMAVTAGRITPSGPQVMVVLGDELGDVAYRLGLDLDTEGVPGRWSAARRLHDPLGAPVSGADIALADLDGDGRAELVFVYTVDDRICYRIGWRLSDDGLVTGGWSDTVTLPYRLSGLGDVAVDVADVTQDLRPDLVVFLSGTDAGGAPFAGYGIGRTINRRGVVLGGWSDLIPVPQDRETGWGHGAGIVAADFSGTRRPDLLVYRVGSTSGLNDAVYRVGFDLDETGTATGWTEARPVDRLAGASVRGGGVALADLRPSLVADRAAMGDDFMKAALEHQKYLAPAQARAKDARGATVAVDATAAAVRERLRPDLTVPRKVLDGLRLGDGPLAEAVPDTGDPLRRLLAGVRFTVPAYELLRGLSQENVVPGLPEVAPETLTALAANPRFIEAFLVGLNHEMSREMLWRGFPADPRTTWFPQFWDVRNALPAGAPPTDIPPLTDPAWRNGALGTHLTAVGAPGERSLILVIRGEAMRRYPSTVVTMRAAVWKGAVRRPAGPDVPPTFHAWLNPDLLLFGFPLTAEEARGDAAPEADRPGHFFILREQPTAPRFGVDDPPDDWVSGTPWSGAHWDDLHWGHLPADASFLSPHAPGFGTAPLDGAVYGRNAADMARVVLQRPALVARHASDLLPPDPAPEARTGPAPGALIVPAVTGATGALS